MAIHEGTFQSGDETFTYRTIEWKEEGGEYKTDITDDDLLKVDDMRIEIENSNQEIQYQTINGRMENWDFVEAILSYDWGDEGSRSFK